MQKKTKIERKRLGIPDIALAALKLATRNIARSIKNDLALIERVPPPETGLHFLDTLKYQGRSEKLSTAMMK